MSYAEKTSVPVAKSRAEIESIVTRYGASRFASILEAGRAVIVFEAVGRRVMFELPLPDAADFKLKEVKNGWGGVRTKERSPQAQEEAWEQACRQRWRALALVIKAKLEAVESGITTFEDEFLAHIVLPDGKTFGRWAKPQLAQAYDSGKMPPLLPAGSGQ